MTTTQPSDPNARPCFLHGHQWRYYADGSHDCLSCGIWHGPETKMVNELLRAASGRKTYANEALILARLSAPKVPKPMDPPLVLPLPTTEKGCTVNQMTPGLIFIAAFVFTSLVLIGIRLGQALWEYLSVGHLS